MVKKTPHIDGEIKRTYKKRIIVKNQNLEKND
jgi:hypothetical protein